MTRTSPARALAMMIAVFALIPSLSQADTVTGTTLTLQAVPTFVQRVFVPVLPSSVNLFAIRSLRIDEVLEAPQGFQVSVQQGQLRITAPGGDAFGYAKVRTGDRELTLTLMNMVPSTSVKNGKLEGYRIGTYLSKALKGLSSYEAPKGFIRLTSTNSNAWVSDHYRLRDFQCKLDGASKFLYVRPEALLKLELMQHELGKAGVQFARFTIMSGYRTPYYNAMIGNETSYSRHLYGDAMDIYIDGNGDSNMDDINHDGRVDRADAIYLLRFAEKIDKSLDWGWLKGGAGVYKANAAHGPYLHIDARGYIARWGL